MPLSVKTSDGGYFYARVETISGIPPFLHLTEEEAASVAREMSYLGKVKEPYLTIINQAIHNLAHHMPPQGSS